MTRTAEIRMPWRVIEEWNALMSRGVEPGRFPPLANVFDATARFDDGCEADVRINVDDDDESPSLWSEAVLYDDGGHELALSDPDFDRFGLRWELWCDDDVYVVSIVPATDE